MQLTIRAKPEQDKDGTWWYVHVPVEVRAKWKALEKRGAIAVTAIIGETTWDGSILPWADGSGQISVNKVVRAKESLSLGQELTIHIKPCVSPSL